MLCPRAECSLVGGILFTVASYIGLIEVTRSFNPFAFVQQYSHGFIVAHCNLWGSVLFLIAGALYFPEAELMEETRSVDVQDAGWQLKQYGVRLPYAVGSFLFFIGACFGVHEVLNQNE